MSQPKPFSSLDLSLPGFQRSLKKLSPEARSMADQALMDLLLPEVPGKYGFKKLAGYRNPGIFTIMLGGNHSHKISMEIRNGVAILRRVGTHKELDDNP